MIPIQVVLKANFAGFGEKPAFYEKFSFNYAKISDNLKRFSYYTSGNVCVEKKGKQTYVISYHRGIYNKHQACALAALAELSFNV